MAARSPRQRMDTRWAAAVAVALALAVLMVACTTDDVADGPADEASADAVDRQADADRTSEERDRAEVETEVDEVPEAAGDGEPAAVADLGDLGDADPQRRLIREGSVTVGFADTFESAYRRVTDLVANQGGGVLDLTSTTDDEGVTRGAVTVEVPVSAYDALLDGIADVGVVLRRDVRTEDVTEEYVDLRSRLRHLERTEEFFLELFDDADSVDEAITVRDRLDSVQQRIEEIEGRLRRLEEQTEMSRLTVELVPEDDELDDPPLVAGFAAYWADAREAFVSVAGTLLVVAVGGAPLVVAGAAALAVVVVLVRTWRSASAAGAE